MSYMRNVQSVLIKEKHTHANLEHLILKIVIQHEDLCIQVIWWTCVLYQASLSLPIWPLLTINYASAQAQACIVRHQYKQIAQARVYVIRGYNLIIHDAYVIRGYNLIIHGISTWASTPTCDQAYIYIYNEHNQLIMQIIYMLVDHTP